MYCLLFKFICLTALKDSKFSAISLLPHTVQICKKLLGTEPTKTHIWHKYVPWKHFVHFGSSVSERSCNTAKLANTLLPPVTSPASLIFQKHKVSLRLLQVFHLSRRPGIKILRLPTGLCKQKKFKNK